MRFFGRASCVLGRGEHFLGPHLQEERMLLAKQRTALPPRAYHFCDMCVFWASLSKGRVATPYIAIAMVPLESCPLETAVFYLRQINPTGLNLSFEQQNSRQGKVLLLFLTAKLRLKQLKKRENSFTFSFFILRAQKMNCVFSLAILA